MHQTDRVADWIDQVNGATIGDVNSETNAALICDQAVATVETFVRCGRLIDNPDARTVHLLRGYERRVAEPVFSSNFPMDAVQSSQRFHFVVRHLDAGNTQSETVNDTWQRPKRWELFSRKLSGVHFPEGERKLRLVSTGVRIPA
jgi:hypothetical protein